MEDHFTKRNRFTRMCIGEAVLALMEGQEFEKIKISDVVKKAGISRMTFYHYYHSNAEALKDYLDEIIMEYLQVSEHTEGIGRFHEKQHILFSLEFFDRYAALFLKLVKAKLYSLIIDAVNEFMLEQISPSYDGSVYELYYYGGALLNIFIKWEENGKKETAEEIAEILSVAVR